MTLRPDWEAYFRSLADELVVQSGRVRNLIGSRHWLSDGTHKEALLAQLLQRHMPSTVMLGKGFIVDPVSGASSREQDILIVDTTIQGVLLNEGGLVITLPSAVVATVSVKSRMTVKSLRETVENQNSARSLMAARSRKLLSCGFFYDATPAIRKDPVRVFGKFAEATRKYPVAVGESSAGRSVLSSPGPDVLCYGGEGIYRVRPSLDVGGWRICGYRCSGVATAAFLALLIDHVTVSRSGDDGPGFPDLCDELDVASMEPSYLEL